MVRIHVSSREVISMPDPNTRHARTKWEWNVGEGRNELTRKAVQDDPARVATPAKKKRGECKQNQWGPHEFAIIEDPTALHFPRQYVRDCHWAAGWSQKNQDYRPRWDCYHAELCVHCGKRKRENFQLAADECPNYVPDIPPDVVLAAEVEQERFKNRPIRSYFRRPRQPITGPQGYRKPKSG